MSAQFMNQKKPPRLSLGEDQGFGAMGKMVPISRKKEADLHLKAMGITDAEDRFTCIQLVSGRLERDEPYGAMEDAMKYVDLTGAYRLMAVLLTDPPALRAHGKK